MSVVHMGLMVVTEKWQSKTVGGRWFFLSFQEALVWGCHPVGEHMYKMLLGETKTTLRNRVLAVSSGFKAGKGTVCVELAHEASGNILEFLSLGVCSWPSSLSFAP